MSSPIADGIIVHRCVVHVVRRGGWSWGPDPRSLVRQAMEALPELLAERFAEHFAEDGPDVEITEPVRVTVRLGGRSHDRPAFVSARTGVAVQPAAIEPAGSTELEDEPAVATVPVRDVAALFAELAEREELAPLLALLPDTVFVAYAAALLEDGQRETDGTVFEAIVAELARRTAVAPEAPEPTRAEVRRLLRSLAEPDPGTTADASDTDLPTTVAVALPGSVTAGETRVCGALPFLLAGPLARTGYLDALGPTLAGADLLGEAPLFAAALAYKVLGTPERGWRRTPADHATAAAFAGLESVPDLGVFARRVRQALPVLDGVLALSVCRGHDPAEPLVIAGVDGGLLLVDARGMFPIAWTRDVAGLLPHWVACGRPAVAVCDSPLPVDCLRDLVSAGVVFVTDVRPLRGDPVTRLPWRSPLWTSGGAGPGLAAALPAYADRVAELAGELFTARRAVLRDSGDALDRGVALAASVALGMIAWTLWRDRETTDPVAALTRFADLEATVRYGADAVQVRLPLGRRHADLLRHGALTDVHDVVWLDGRTLTFSGG